MELESSPELLLTVRVLLMVQVRVLVADLVLG